MQLNLTLSSELLGNSIFNVKSVVIIRLSELTIPARCLGKNPLVGACSHGFQDAVLACQASSPYQGVFLLGHPSGLRPLAAHLNRWLGREDTQHSTRVWVPACQRGTGVVMRTTVMTNRVMNESLPSGSVGLRTYSWVGAGKIDMGYHPRGTYGQKQGLQ